MKKIIASLLLLTVFLGLLGCKRKTYQLDWDWDDGFCFTASHIGVRLESNEAGYLMKLFNESTWENKPFDCAYDFYFYTADSYDYSSMDCARLAVGRMLSKTALS